MRIAYGIKIRGPDDPYIAKIEESVEGINLAGHPASFLVDLIPTLKHVPSWLPGAGFKTQADYWRKVNQKVVELPFNQVVQEMVGLFFFHCFSALPLKTGNSVWQKKGTAGPSLAATLISALPEGDGRASDEERKIAQNVTAVAYIGRCKIACHLPLGANGFSTRWGGHSMDNTCKP